MQSVDLAQWAIVAPFNETGVGRMTQDLRRLLHPIRLLAVPSQRLKMNQLAGNDQLLAWDKGDEALRAQLAGLQGVICFEDDDYVHRTIEVASQMQVKTVLFVLWEWFRSYVRAWKKCDLFICNTRFAEKIVHGFGHRNTQVITWPVDISTLPKRVISGPARTFFHNAGLLEPDDRKATREVVEAFSLVRRPDVQLIVRLQNQAALSTNDPRIIIKTGHLADFRDLYKEGDVAVHPSKCEGLGFALLEAIACGLPLITTDYPPMNEYVTRKSMLVATRWWKYKAEQTSYVPQAHFKIPRVKDLARKIIWCADNDMGPISRENQAWAEQTFAPARVREQWLAMLQALLAR